MKDFYYSTVSSSEYFAAALVGAVESRDTFKELLFLEAGALKFPLAPSRAFRLVGIVGAFIIIYLFIFPLL